MLNHGREISIYQVEGVVKAVRRRGAPAWAKIERRAALGVLLAAPRQRENNLSKI